LRRVSGAAADPSPQLMQLGKAKPLRMLDHHDRRLGHVDANFDDSGGDQHFGFAGAKPFHRCVALCGLHAAVDEPHFDSEGLAKCSRPLFRCGKIKFFGFFHQRAHPKGALPACDGTAQTFDDLVHSLGGDDARVDGFASGRKAGDT